MKKLVLLCALAACEAHEAQSNPTTVTVEPPAPVETAKPPAPKYPPLEFAPDLPQRLERFAVIPVGVDDSKLDARTKSVLKKLVQAAQLIQQVFLRQGDAQNLDLRGRLVHAARLHEPLPHDALVFFDFMGGPWDRTEPDQRPVIGTRKKPPGGNFYPEDVTKDQIEKWIADHPNDKAAFQSYFTVIRHDGSGLKAVPFAQEFKEQLEPAAQLLREAAALADDKRIKDFLEKRAAAFASNDYMDSDIAWMDLGDAPLEITIGPYEVYDDELMGWKASYEAFIGTRDAQESARLAKVNDSLAALDKNLPLDAKYRAHATRGAGSPISVVQLVYSSGQPGIHATAYNLPNDERVRKLKGSKKVMLKNISEAKFKVASKPIAERALVDSQHAAISFDGLFTFVLMHEMAHGLGPAQTVAGEDVGKALQELYSAIEEAKADVCGVVSTQWLIDHNVFPKSLEKAIYVAHIASAFRSVRFGATEAHSKGELASFNFIVKQGGFKWDAKAKRWAVDFGKIKAAERALAHEWLTLEAEGNRAKAKAFFDQYAVMKPEMQQILDGLKDIPVDIRPDFTVLEKLASW